MRGDCPQCAELRHQAAQRGADLGALLTDVALHEATAHPPHRPMVAAAPVLEPLPPSLDTADERALLAFPWSEYRHRRFTG
ncbi:hypothetical protein ABZX93_35185 [Streptomyces sp. NPDC006632]|uniref:hypothetical protein n=1 Tax=Streptomyces sp. NPDC006632 TaxID=3157182 RepID=UPI0033A85172